VNNTINEIEVIKHSLKFASLLEKKKSKGEHSKNSKEFFSLNKVYLGVEKYSQVKEDKAKNTLSQRITTKLKEFEKTIKKISKQES